MPCLALSSAVSPACPLLSCLKLETGAKSGTYLTSSYYPDNEHNKTWMHLFRKQMIQRFPACQIPAHPSSERRHYQICITGFSKNNKSITNLIALIYIENIKTQPHCRKWDCTGSIMPDLEEQNEFLYGWKQQSVHKKFFRRDGYVLTVKF